jgi:hypothetical protein
MNSESSKDLPGDPDDISLESPDRRDALQKFGKFAAYAAPFTVLALAQKADAATGTGPHRHL